MQCLEAQAVLSAQHDGEAVTDAEAQAARAHCASCRSCDAFVRTLDRLDRVARPALPEGLADRIMEAAQAQAAPRTTDATVEVEPAGTPPIDELVATEPAARSPRVLWLRAAP